MIARCLGVAESTVSMWARGRRKASEQHLARLFELDSAAEQVLSAYEDCVRVLGHDLLAEVKSLMPASQQGL
jgi:hypothetical protein